MRERIPAVFAHTGCRLFQEVLVPRYNHILNMRRPNEKVNLMSHKAMLFFEYVGNNIQTLELIRNILTTYPNVKYFLVIDDCYEGLIDDRVLEELDKIMRENDNIDKIKILSSNKNLETKVSTLFKSEMVFQYYNIHSYMSAYDHVSPGEHVHRVNPELREKKFLCVNRQERVHRIMTVDFLSRNDILKHSHTSCLLGDYAPLLYNDTEFTMQNPNLEKYQDPALQKLRLSNDSKDRLRKTLPLELDIKEHQLKSFAVNMPDLGKYFDQSYFSIVTEGDFNSSTQKKQYTEKILKCFLYHHPFVVLGLPGTLELLREEGFITFSSFVDENYDSETNDDKRMNMVFSQIKKLNELNMHQFKNMYEDMLPILEHNYRHCLNRYRTDQPGNLVNEILDWYYL